MRIFWFSLAVFGLALRLYSLFNRSFWFDEAFTYEVSKLPTQYLLKALLFDNNPPFYYLIIHLILKLNNSEFWLRLPSLVTGMATVPLIYFFGKKFLNLKTGKIAATLFTLSSLSIYLAAEARPHSLAIFLLMCTVYAFFNLREKPDSKNTVVFLIISTLAIYTQFYIVLVLLACITIILLEKKSPKAKTLLVPLLPILILLPWVLLSKGAVHNVCWCPNTILSLPSSLVSPSVSGVGIVTLRSFIDLPFLFLALFFATATSCLFFFLRGLTQNTVLASLYLIPLVCLSIAGLFLPVFSPKAFSIFTPIYFLITSLSLSKAPRLIVSGLILLMGATSIVQVINPAFGGERIKEAYTNTLPDFDLPVYHTSLVTYYSFDFYSRGQQKNILLTPNPLSGSTISTIGGETKKVEENTEHAWLVDVDKWTSEEDRQKVLKDIFAKNSAIQTTRAGTITINLLKRK